MRNKLVRLAAMGLILAPALGNGSDIFIGVRGPTEWQLDLRQGHIERKDKLGNRLTIDFGNAILKYWNGDKAGLFGFVNVPYRSIDNGKSNSDGLGDVALGIGPRLRFDFGNKGSLHLLSYAGASLPTGDSKETPSLGNDRVDGKFGLYSTYLSSGKRFEIDGSFEYSLAGVNRKGVRGLDEMNTGIVVGGRLTKDNLIRAAMGMTARFKEKSIEGELDYAYGPRTVIRITPPKSKWHMELIGDYDVRAKGLSKGFGIGSIFRYNF